MSARNYNVVFWACLLSGALNLWWAGGAIKARATLAAAAHSAPSPAALPRSPGVARATPEAPKTASIGVAAAPSPAEAVAPGRIVIHFDVAQCVLQLNQKREIRESIGKAQIPPDSEILIEGHADVTGNEESNIALSKMRAESVGRLLGGLGYGRTRIQIKAFGSTRPLDNRTTSDALAKNRRVVLIFRKGNL